MKILLTLPPSNALTITPPIGLGYMASVLLESGYNVSILDSQRESFNIEKFLRKIKEINPDVLGISILSSNYTNAKKVIKRIKESNPQIKIVVGGPHPSALPEMTLRDTKVEFLIRGEGEYALLKLIKFLKCGEGNPSLIENLCYWENGQIKIKQDITRIKDLDKLPFPSWNLMHPKKYPRNPHQFFFKEYPIAPIITSRGCPFGCIFCSASSLFGREIRRRSAKNVVDEIELLVNRYGVKEIHFEDDNLTFGKEHVAQICQEIIRRRIRIIWQCPNGIRIDTIDKDLIHLMKKSGCYRLSFGIESGSQEILDKINKKLDLKNISRIIKIVKDQSIEVQGFFILGLPGETEETMKKTMEFIKAHDFDLVGISFLAYLPGTDLSNKRYGDGGYENIEWDEFNYFSAQPTDSLSREVLKKFQKLGLRQFYFNLKNIRFLIQNIKIQQIPHIFKIILKLFI